MYTKQLENINYFCNFLIFFYYFRMKLLPFKLEFSIILLQIFSFTVLDFRFVQCCINE